METSDIDFVAGIKKNLENMKESFKLTTERCFYASKDAFTVYFEIWTLSNKNSPSARECIQNVVKALIKYSKNVKNRRDSYNSGY